MVDKDGRNFRAFYYDTLGLRNVEQRKALEILLKDDPIGNGQVAAKIFLPYFAVFYEGDTLIKYGYPNTQICNLL